MSLDHPFDVVPDDGSRLTLALQRGTDGQPRILITGEVDRLSAARVQRAVIEVLRAQRPRAIELELSGVRFLDSAGIRALLLCHADAEQLDCRVTLTRPHPAAYRVLDITGLTEHFGLVGEPSEPTVRGAGVQH